MKSITTTLSNLIKSSSQMVSGGMKSIRVFNAYEAGDYETMMSLVSTMSEV